MVSARKKGMTNGDYVYIVSTLSDIYRDLGLDYWWKGISGRVDKTEVEKAWHSVLTLVPRPYNATKYRKFQKQVIDKLDEIPESQTDETPDEVSMTY